MNKPKVDSSSIPSNHLRVTTESFFLFSIPSILAVPLALFSQINFSSFFTAILIGVEITSVIGIYIYFVNFLTQKFQKTLTPKQTFLFTSILIGSAGALRGFLFFLSVGATEFEQPTTLSSRVISSTATTLFWLILISVVVNESKSFRARYEGIFKSSALKIAQELSNSKSISLNQELRANFTEIESTLNATFDKATRDAIDRDSLLLAASQVRNVINEKIRPLSHRLWIKGSDTTPKIKLASTLVSGIRYLEVPPLLIANNLALFSLINLSSAFGLYRGLIGTFTVYAISFFFFLLFNRNLKSKFKGKLFPNFLTTLLPGLLIALVQYLTNRFIFDDDLGALSLVNVLVTGAVAILISARQISQKDRESLLRLISKDLETLLRSQGQKLDISDTEAASYLHNSLQSELLAISYQLEESAKNPESDETKALLEQLASRINRSIGDEFESFVLSPFDRVKRLQSAWKGIAEVKIDFPEILPTNELQNYLLVQIIEESISNAVRFSGSTVVDVDIKDGESGCLNVSITANGSAGPQNPAGLGTEWLDRYAPGKWSRTYSDSGSVLRIIL